MALWEGLKDVLMDKIMVQEEEKDEVALQRMCRREARKFNKRLRGAQPVSWLEYRAVLRSLTSDGENLDWAHEEISSKSRSWLTRVLNRSNGMGHADAMGISQTKPLQHSQRAHPRPDQQSSQPPPRPVLPDSIPQMPEDIQELCRIRKREKKARKRERTTAQLAERQADPHSASIRSAARSDTSTVREAMDQVQAGRVVKNRRGKPGRQWREKKRAIMDMQPVQAVQPLALSLETEELRVGKKQYLTLNQQSEERDARTEQYPALNQEFQQQPTTTERLTSDQQYLARQQPSLPQIPPDHPARLFSTDLDAREENDMRMQANTHPLGRTSSQSLPADQDDDQMDTSPPISQDSSSTAERSDDKARSRASPELGDPNWRTTGSIRQSEGYNRSQPSPELSDPDWRTSRSFRQTEDYSRSRASPELGDLDWRKSLSLERSQAHIRRRSSPDLREAGPLTARIASSPIELPSSSVVTYPTLPALNTQSTATARPRTPSRYITVPHVTDTSSGEPTPGTPLQLFSTPPAYAATSGDDTEYWTPISRRDSSDEEPVFLLPNDSQAMASVEGRPGVSTKEKNVLRERNIERERELKKEDGLEEEDDLRRRQDEPRFQDRNCEQELKREEDQKQDSEARREDDMRPVAAILPAEPTPPPSPVPEAGFEAGFFWAEVEPGLHRRLAWPKFCAYMRQKARKGEKVDISLPEKLAPDETWREKVATLKKEVENLMYTGPTRQRWTDVGEPEDCYSTASEDDSALHDEPLRYRSPPRDWVRCSTSPPYWLASRDISLHSDDVESDAVSKKGLKKRKSSTDQANSGDGSRSRKKRSTSRSKRSNSPSPSDHAPDSPAPQSGSETSTPVSVDGKRTKKETEKRNRTRKTKEKGKSTRAKTPSDDEILPPPEKVEDAASAKRGQKISTPKKKAPAKSPYFPTSPSSKKKRAPAGTVSCLPFPPTNDVNFGLIQERLANNPWQLLVAVAFLNRTTARAALPVFWTVIAKYPTPESLAAISPEDLVPQISTLGLQVSRARNLVRMAHAWISDPPRHNRRHRRLNYPTHNTGHDIAPLETLTDDDPRYGAWEIAHLPGVGTYALDSWRIFCRDVLRKRSGHWLGMGGGRDFRPEWERVLPRDKELRAFLKWRWLKAGWEWDAETGRRRWASVKLEAAAREGVIDFETWEEGLEEETWPWVDAEGKTVAGQEMGVTALELEASVEMAPAPQQQYAPVTPKSALRKSGRIEALSSSSHSTADDDSARKRKSVSFDETPTFLGGERARRRMTGQDAMEDAENGDEAVEEEEEEDEDDDDSEHMPQTHWTQDKVELARRGLEKRHGSDTSHIAVVVPSWLPALLPNSSRLRDR